MGAGRVTGESVTTVISFSGDAHNYVKWEWKHDVCAMVDVDKRTSKWANRMLHCGSF